MFGSLMAGGIQLPTTVAPQTPQQGMGGFGQFMANADNRALLARMGAQLMQPRRPGTTAGNVANVLAQGMTEYNQRKKDEANTQREREKEDRTYDLNKRRVEAEEGRADLSREKFDKENERYDSPEAQEARSADTNFKRAQTDYYKARAHAERNPQARGSGDIPSVIQTTDYVADILVKQGKYDDIESAKGEAWIIANQTKGKSPTALVDSVAQEAFKTSFANYEDVDRALKDMNAVRERMMADIDSGVMTTAGEVAPPPNPQIEKLKTAIQTAGGLPAYEQALTQQWTMQGVPPEEQQKRIARIREMAGGIQQ